MSFFSRCSEQINKFEYIKRNTLNIEMKSRFQEAFDKMMGSSIHAIKVSYVFTNLNQFVVLLIYVCIVGTFRLFADYVVQPKRGTCFNDKSRKQIYDFHRLRYYGFGRIVPYVRNFTCNFA